MPPAGFEPKMIAGERPQTVALDRATTGTALLLTLGARNYNATFLQGPVPTSGKYWNTNLISPLLADLVHERNLRNTSHL
jgi:hypothetical protein